jgi:hypothetical protein
MTDEAARRQITSARDGARVGVGAAGPGKTTARVERIGRVIAAGRAAGEGFGGVSLTEKAAGER